MKRGGRSALLGALLALVGCSQPVDTTRLGAIGRLSPAAVVAPVALERRALREADHVCTGAFVLHELPHVTTVPGDAVEMFEANGAGVAVNDLDDDGDLDIVLANHAAPNTLLWNVGGLYFRKENLGQGDSRGANIVDVDGDGALDIVFTRRMSGPNLWRNTGSTTTGARFTLELMPGISAPAYAINWGDPDDDNDLDLLAGSYDAGLLSDLGDSFLFGSGAGVYLYEFEDGRYTPLRLAGSAQALAVAFFDVNQDTRPDILVGNDFAVYDYAWIQEGKAWKEAQPFTRTSHSTMSLDTGDIDNDGAFELFSTDMKPYALDVETLAIWRNLMTEVWDPPLKGDPQLMENMLQVRDSSGAFRNEAYERRVDATGWSWSGKFGDLDNDGFLDLYVVNGMIEAEIFSHLPRNELAEHNQALHNDGKGRFVPAPHWGLGSTLSGRGMSMGDLDLDGDLDIVVNNLRGPAQLFENRLCGGGSLQIDLHWRGVQNTRAVGATLALHTDQGSIYRDVRAASGYLSGDPARVHFGMPTDQRLERLEIMWPDGATSTIDKPEPQQLLVVTRD